MWKINPAGLTLLEARVQPIALRGAEAAAEVLKAKLSGPGTGRQYPGLPNRSSSQHEYPAEQSSALKDSIDARPSGHAGAVFGAIRSPPAHAGLLHFDSAESAAAMHFRPPEMGGRPFMLDALQDRDIHQAIRQAMGLK